MQNCITANNVYILETVAMNVSEYIAAQVCVYGWMDRQTNRMAVVDLVKYYDARS